MPQVLRVLSVYPQLDDIDDAVAGPIVSALDAAGLTYPEEGDEATYERMLETLENIGRASPSHAVRVLYAGLSDAWFDCSVLSVDKGQIDDAPVALSLEPDAPQPAVFPHEAAPVVDVAITDEADLIALVHQVEAATDGREVAVEDRTVRLPFYFEDPDCLMDAVRVGGVPAWLVITRGEGATVHPVYAWSADERERAWLRDELGVAEPAARPCPAPAASDL